jgi:hypothetical protein
VPFPAATHRIRTPVCDFHSLLKVTSDKLKDLLCSNDAIAGIPSETMTQVCGFQSSLETNSDIRKVLLRTNPAMVKVPTRTMAQVRGFHRFL